MEAVMPCKMGTRKRLRKLRAAVASENTNPRKKTKYACIVEAHETTSKSLEYTLPRNHEDHIAEKGFNPINHNNLVRTFIPMPHSIEIPDAQAAVDKEKEMLQKVHFVTLMDICHLKNAELEAKQQKYKGPVVLRGDTVKDDSGAHAIFTEQGSSASQNDYFKSNGRYSKITHHAKQKTQRNINLHPKKKKTLQGCYKFQDLNIQICTYVFHDTIGQHLGQTSKIQWS